jgi:hypothetical protein
VYQCPEEYFNGVISGIRRMRYNMIFNTTLGPVAFSVTTAIGCQKILWFEFVSYIYSECQEPNIYYRRIVK